MHAKRLYMWDMFISFAISVIKEKWKEIAFFKFNRIWKEIAISKLLFPSTPFFLRDLKVEGNSNESGRK